VNCCRNSLGQHDRLLRRLLDRERATGSAKLSSVVKSKSTKTSVESTGGKPPLRL
jgi:hypothetical protein